MAYTVFESINMASTHRGGARVYDCVSTVDIENGTFGYCNGLAADEVNVYNFAKGTATGKMIVVVDQPCWDEDSHLRSNQRRDNFIIKKGTKFRVREVRLGDNFGITAEGVESTTRAKFVDGTNKYLTINSDGKLVAAESASQSAVPMEAVCENSRVMGGTLVTTAHNYGHSAVMYNCKVTVLA